MDRPIIGVHGCRCFHGPEKHDELGCFGNAGYCRCEGTAIYADDVVEHGKPKPETSLQRRWDVVDTTAEYGTAAITLEGCNCTHLLLAHDTSRCWAKDCPCTGRVVRARELVESVQDCCPCTSLEDTETCKCWCHLNTATCCDHPATWEAVFQCDCACHTVIDAAVEDVSTLSEHDNIAAAILVVNQQLDEEALIKSAQRRIAQERTMHD